jgi:hypothetical protein
MDINFAEKNIGATKVLYELANNQDQMKLQTKRNNAKKLANADDKKFKKLEEK